MTQLPKFTVALCTLADDLAALAFMATGSSTLLSSG